jgi:hypothetical protein
MGMGLKLKVEGERERERDNFEDGGADNEDECGLEIG